MKKLHFTRFLLSWALIGVLLGGALVFYFNYDFSQLSGLNINSQQHAPDSYAGAVKKAAPSVVSIQAYYLEQQAENLLSQTQPQHSQPEFKVRPRLYRHKSSCRRRRGEN